MTPPSPYARNNNTVLFVLLLHYYTHTPTHYTLTMSKENISATVDPEVAEFVNQDHINISGLVNSLLHEYMESGTNDIETFRMRQVESEYRDLASRARHKLEEYNELKEMVEEDTQDDAEKRDEWAEKLRQVPDDPDHPLVQQAAEDLDTTPEDVLGEVSNQ